MSTENSQEETVCGMVEAARGAGSAAVDAGAETKHVFVKRLGTGRRKSKPWRSPWDYSVSVFPLKTELPKPSKTSKPAKDPLTRWSRPKSDVHGPCNHCGTTTSPQWRKGPKGKPILCNACGIRFLRTRSLGKALPRASKKEQQRQQQRAQARGDAPIPQWPATAPRTLKREDSGEDEHISETTHTPTGAHAGVEGNLAAAPGTQMDIDHAPPMVHSTGPEDEDLTNDPAAPRRGSTRVRSNGGPRRYQEFEV